MSRRGIRFIPNPPKLTVEPASLLTDADREVIREHEPALLAYLCARALADEAEVRGRDLLDHLCEHAPDLLDEADDRVVSPAESLTATCARYGIVLSLAPDGQLVIGNGDESGNEPALWPSLRMAIEANRYAITKLIAAGWSLRAGFPKTRAA